jgi:glutamyl-tRNA reductase
MSVPRNIDPEVRGVPGVHLYDIDDLRTMCPAGPEEREMEMAKANSILEEESERFDFWWRSLRVVPTISALLANVEETRSQELAKTLRRLPSISDREREKLDALTRAIIKKVLHQPITHLKRHNDDQDCLAVAQALFGLQPPDALADRNGHRAKKADFALLPANGSRPGPCDSPRPSEMAGHARSPAA